MHPIENILKCSMEHIREMVDVNTIIGDPVSTKEGDLILPVSKVSFGFVSGGAEYGKGGSARDAQRDTTENPFAGGSGAGISLNPVAFVVLSQGTVRLLPIEANSFCDKISELLPQVLCFIKDIGKKYAADKTDAKKQEPESEIPDPNTF